MKKSLFFLILILLLSPLISWEQKNNIPDPLKVLYPFSLKIQFDKSYNLLKANLTNSDNLLKQDEEQWRLTVADSLVLTLLPLKTGEIEVPAIQIITYDEFGSDTLYTAPFQILVTAVTDSTTLLTDIKPISDAKAPILMESQYGWLYKLLKGLIIALILALIGWLSYKYFEQIKRFFRKNKLAEELIILLPWEFALNELKQIKQKMLIVKGKEYPFSIEMSLLIRRFLEKYYHFPAAERTTYELKAELTNMKIENRDKIISVLKRLDEVKYTQGKIVTDFDSQDIFSWFEEIVTQIKVSEEKKAVTPEVK